MAPTEMLRAAIQAATAVAEDRDRSDLAALFAVEAGHNHPWVQVALRALTLADQRRGGRDYVWLPREPTEEMWGGLARQIVMWTRFGRPTGAALHDHLKSTGWAVPDWLAAEIPDVDHVPPKGTVAVVIYRIMVEAFEAAPASRQGEGRDQEGRDPGGSDCRPTDQAPSGLAGSAASIPRAKLLALAEEQVAYWRGQQTREQCQEDCISEDGMTYTPMGDDAALSAGRANGWYSSSDWWLKTILYWKGERDDAPAPGIEARQGQDPQELGAIARQPADAVGAPVVHPLPDQGGKP